MIINPVRFPRQGNPLWPLPPDYHELHADGRRMARLNAVSLGATGNPNDAVVAWAAFTKMYLEPDPASGFDPGFYKPPYLPAAPGHYHFVKWMHQFPNIAVEAPRGWAKSTVKRSVILWKLLTDNRPEINSFLAKDDFVLEETFRLKMQLEENRRIQEDFGVLRPTRGAGLWTGHTLTLSNGAIYRGVPIEGKKRGLRGWAFLDDIEYDEGTPRSKERLEELKEQILKIILPMMDDGCRLVVAGTFLGRNTFLFHVIQTNDDERFKSVEQGGDWFKIVIPAINTRGENAWAAKYTPVFLDRKRRTMGEAFFQTEYMGNPMSEDRAALVLRPDAHEYHVLGEPQSDPLTGHAKVTFHEVAPDGGQRAVEQPFHELARGMQRVLTVDAASSLKSSADFSAIVVGGIDSTNTLWVLDAWQARVYPVQLAAKAWELARKWKVSLIAVESFGPYIEIYRLIRDWGNTHPGDEWRPAVLEYRPPATYSKEDRILSLSWRFDQGRIKLPGHLRIADPAIRELYHQITNFTPDGRGLQHDDLIDAVSAVHFVLRSSGHQASPMPRPVTMEERFLAGEVNYPGTDVPIIGAVDWKSIPEHLLGPVLEAARERHARAVLLGDPLEGYPPALEIRLG